MGGKSSKTKISRYLMSQWWGLAIKVDAVLKVEYGEKTMWSGRITDSQTVSISKTDLYGGDKKEGGVEGRMTVLMGDDQQVMPSGLAQRLGVATGAGVPGFRGVTSVFFTGTGGGTVTGYNGKPMVGPNYGIDVHNLFDSAGGVWDLAFGQVSVASVISASKGFYWTANSPYLKQPSFEVERIPRQLDPATAAIRRDSISVSASVQDWRYLVVVRTDPADYSAVDFDDSSWPLGKAPFASSPWSLPGDYGFATEPATVVPVGHKVWMRGTLSLPSVPISMRFQAFVDNYCRLYINGVLAASVGANNGAYYDVALNPSLFVVGDNSIAVVGWDAHDSTVGNWFWFDWRAIGFSSEVLDANPAHIIYECLIEQSWGLGEDPANLDVPSFLAAAKVLYDEGFGLSLIWDAASAIEDFVNSILAHVNGVIFTHPATGKLTLRLVRNDFDTATVREVNPDNTKLTRFSRKAWGDTINEIQVTWTDPADEDASRVILQDAGNIAQQGFINSSTNDYPGIRSQALAGTVAERDLRAASSPLCTAEGEVNRSFYDVTPMEVVKLHWPEYGVEAVYCRVASVTYGGLGQSALTLALTEDIFSYPVAEYIDAGGSSWGPGTPGEEVIAGSYIMPAPYLGLSSVLGVENPTIDPPTTYASVVAAVDPGSATTYSLFSEAVQSNGSTAYQSVDADREFLLKTSLPSELSGASVSVLSGLLALPNGVVIIGSPSLGAAHQELAMVSDIDGTTGAATLWRGIADTTPKPWVAGTEVWVGSLEDLTAEPTARIEGATAKYKILPVWADSGLDSAAILSGPVPARASLPYPPGNVMIGGVDAFSVASATGAFVVTWAHRNKVTQAENIVRQDAASITPENDVRYGLRILDASNAVLVERSDIAGDTATVNLAYTGQITVRLWTIDDNGASFQTQVRSLAYTAGAATSNTITAPTYDPSGAITIIDGGDLDG